MKKWILRILVAVVILGLLGFGANAVYQIAYRQGFAAASDVLQTSQTQNGQQNDQKQVLPQGKAFGFRRQNQNGMPMDQFHRGLDQRSQGFDQRIRQNHRFGGLALFGIVGGVIKLAVLVLIGWLIYKVIKSGWRVQIVQPAAAPAPQAESKPEDQA